MIKVLTLTIALIPFLLTAQTVTVSEDVSIRNDKFYSLVGKMKNRFLLFRDKDTKFEVQAYDENLRLSWNKELELDRKRPEILDVIPADDHFSMVYQFKKKGDFIVKVHRYNPAANLIDSSTVINYGNRFYTPRPRVVYSEDKKTILIYFFDKQTTLEACVFNLERMETLWYKKIPLDNYNFFRDHQEILVDNRGTMYYITEKDNKKNSRADHRMEVFAYDGYSAGISKFKIPIKDLLTYDVFFEYDNLNKKLVAAGLYSEKSRGKANGYFFLNISPTNPDNFKLHIHPFEEDFISSMMGKNLDVNKGVADIDIQEVVLRRDGGMLLVAERNRQYERRMASASRGYMGRDGGQYIVDYYYEDIIVISLHPNGKTHWKQVLHKRQYSQDDDAVFSSFFLLKTKRNLRFLFNDEIRDESTVSEYVVNGAGAIDRNSVMSTDDQRIRLRFRDAVQVASNELIIPSERRNRLKLVKVTF